MASNLEFVQFVCDQIASTGEIRYRKMFGDYMIYVNNKPIILVCNDIAYIKIKEEIYELMKNADKGYPYEGAKEHYILDIDQRELCEEIAKILEKTTPLPKPKKTK